MLDWERGYYERAIKKIKSRTGKLYEVHPVWPFYLFLLLLFMAVSFCDRPRESTKTYGPNGGVNIPILEKEAM